MALSAQKQRGQNGSAFGALPVCLKKKEAAGILIGNGPNTVSESTVSNTELSEFFCPRRVPGTELSEFLSADLFVCQSELTEFFAELSVFAPKLSETQCALFLRNSTLKTVLSPFPI